MQLEDEVFGAWRLPYIFNGSFYFIAGHRDLEAKYCVFLWNG